MSLEVNEQIIATAIKTRKVAESRTVLSQSAKELYELITLIQDNSLNLSISPDRRALAAAIPAITKLCPTLHNSSCKRSRETTTGSDTTRLTLEVTKKINEALKFYQENNAATTT